MKLLKSFLILFIAISITSCSKDDDDSFELSLANLAGTYEITSYKSVETEVATSSSGTQTTLSSTTKTGSTYTINVALNTDGTYSISGTFLLGYKTSPTPTDGQKDSEILTLNSSGTYTLNVASKTITLTNTTGKAFISGNFDLITFNDSKIVLKQEIEGTGDVSVNSITNITLERK